MTFIHYYQILNEYNRCRNIKNEYLQCLQNVSNSKVCKIKLTELLDCIKTTNPPAAIFNKDKL